MKKILILLVLLPLAGLLAFFSNRYSKNVESIVPYPYSFKEAAYGNLSVDAPILIIGDRMGERLASFSEVMADKISENLSKPIKIASLAAKGEGLHRTLRKIKSLDKLPLIIVYLGGSEESAEAKFRTEDLPIIRENFRTYQNDKAQTAMMVLPLLSRLFYRPVDRIVFSSEIKPDKKKFDDMETIKRNAVNFKLFEMEINELLTYAKDRSSYFIAVSTPINLDVPPKRNCLGSLPDEFLKKYEKTKSLVTEKDYKQAYNHSKELTLLANSSADIHFLHGQIARRIGKIEEAQESLRMAAAYDCLNWRGNPVYNRILKQSAEKHGAAFFDLQKMLKDNWTTNVTFMDEIYPQNFYMEKMADAIALRIKKLLKL